VSDMKKWIKEGQLDDELIIFRDDERLDLSRINAMLSPDDEQSKSDFRYLRTGRAYKMISHFVKNMSQRDVLVKLVGEGNVTAYQLNDILHSNYTFMDLKKAIKQIISWKNTLGKGPRLLADEANLTFIDETQE
jgi:hypothetical protein